MNKVNTKLTKDGNIVFGKNYKTKYAKLIVETLYDYNFLQHTQLAELIGTKPSNLTLFFKKYDLSDLVIIQRDNYNTLYSLTEYAKEHMGDRKVQPQKWDIVQYVSINQLLCNTDNVNARLLAANLDCVTSYFSYSDILLLLHFLGIKRIEDKYFKVILESLQTTEIELTKKIFSIYSNFLKYINNEIIENKSIEKVK